MGRRPDSEHGQALLRAVIVWLILFNTAWIAVHNPAMAPRLWAISLFSVCFSVLLFARVLQRPHASPRRRLAGVIHDNVAVTAWLYAGGSMGALALFVYPFVTVGNGFRYGVRYLACSGVLGAIGIYVLVTAAPGWRSFGLVGIGVLLSHITVTLYTGVLLRQLYQAQEQLARIATCDALTGLPNRRFFLERLADLVEERDRRQIACLYLDLDGFKAVNDRCGHRVGDALLHQVAGTIRGCIRPSDLIARLGGDEFTVVLDRPSSPNDAKVVACRIIKAIEAITSVEGHPVSISASIGISVAPAGDMDVPVMPEELLRAADGAMYGAKRSGKGQWRFAERIPPASAAAGAR